MKINKINTKLIKPKTPTPQTLKNYKISFLDKQIGAVKFAVVLFFKSKPEDDTLLEESLAKVLVQFYPLAGRYIKNDHLVDCSDQGVEFVKAQAQHVELTDLIAKGEINQLKSLLPDQYFRADDQLLSIQVTHFSCGELAIGISTSHTISDASTLGTFISAWSNASNPEKSIGFTPSFNLASLLQYKDHDFGFNSKQLNVGDDQEIVFKRLLFDKEALTRMRSKLRPNSDGQRVSRVRLVCAVIAKTLIGLDRAKHGRSRDFVINQAINMRERTIPPQPKHACGNFAIFSITRRVSASEAMDLGIQELADLIGDAAQKSIDDHVDMLSPSGDGRDIIISTFDNFINHLSNPDTNLMIFTDWSKFGFYEADFGWGKPVWISIGPLQPRVALLMSNKEGGGIEAWLPMYQNDLHYLELDEDIKSFII